VTPQRIAAPEVVTAGDLKELAEAAGPCITMAVDIPDPRQIRTRIKNSIRAAEEALRTLGVDENTAGVLVGPIKSLAASVEIDGEWRRDLILYRSSGIFRYFAVLDLTDGFVGAGAHFHIRPLLPLMGIEQIFYILALSQKQVRLLRATHHHAAEVPLAGVAPVNLVTWINERSPDHLLENRSTAGPSSGSTKGVLFGTSKNDEQHKQNMAHFFREIDAGLHRILGAGDAPLILAGVVEETKLYERVNTYPRLLEQTVQGSPEKISVQELQQRAASLARRAFTKPLTKALDDLDRLRGTSRVITAGDAVLKAASQGRVAQLLVPEGAEWRGDWDEASQQVRVGNQDLLNLAAVETLVHGGDAFELPGSRISDQTGMIALLRF